MLFNYTEEEMKDLVLRIYPRIIRYIRKIVGGNGTEADDVLSDVLTKMLEKKPVILKEKVEGYLFRAVRNECINIVSRKAAERDLVSIDSLAATAWEMLAVADMDDAAAVVDNLAVADIPQILKFSESFKPRTRDIFHMSRVEGMTQEEIAAELGISVRAVQKHLKTSVDEYRKFYGKTDGKPS